MSKTQDSQTRLDASLLEVSNLECRYQDRPIVEHLSFAIATGEIACLLGPSGCGKTTVLRTIAGFNPMAEGRISLAGRVIATRESALAPERRNIGMVFQDYALFPHLTVRKNIGFGLRQIDKKQQQQTIEHLLELVALKDLADRYPHELSGGQQQRVALARALAPKPQLLLMDEPFSNLDTELRRQLSVEVRTILKEAGISAILVTHDQNEAFTVSDRLGVIANGRLQQWDTPFNLYHYPANRLVASFVGEGTFIRGVWQDQGRIDTEIGPIVTKQPPGTRGEAVDVFVRPHEVMPSREPGAVSALVVGKEFLGTATLYSLQLPQGSLVESSMLAHQDYQVGDRVQLQLESEQLVVFPANPG